MQHPHCAHEAIKHTTILTCARAKCRSKNTPRQFSVACAAPDVWEGEGATPKPILPQQIATPAVLRGCRALRRATKSKENHRSLPEEIHASPSWQSKNRAVLKGGEIDTNTKVKILNIVRGERLPRLAAPRGKWDGGLSSCVCGAIVLKTKNESTHAEPCSLHRSKHLPCSLHTYIRLDGPTKKEPRRLSSPAV